MAAPTVGAPVFPPPPISIRSWHRPELSGGKKSTCLEGRACTALGRCMGRCSWGATCTPSRSWGAWWGWRWVWRSWRWSWRGRGSRCQPSSFRLGGLGVLLCPGRDVTGPNSHGSQHHGHVGVVGWWGQALGFGVCPTPSGSCTSVGWLCPTALTVQDHAWGLLCFPPPGAPRVPSWASSARVASRRGPKGDLRGTMAVGVVKRAWRRWGLLRGVNIAHHSAKHLAESISSAGPRMPTLVWSR